MINNRFLAILCGLAVTSSLSGCKDEAPEKENPIDSNVLVINEGNFQSGDGTLATYNSNTEEVAQDVYATANGFPIGATIQNVVSQDDKLYLVTNSPNKLEIIDEISFEVIDYIDQGFNNPYSFAVIGSKGYVTNWGTLNFDTYVYEDPYITIVNLEKYEVIDSIHLELKPQFVVAVGGYFYVSNVGGKTISVYDPATDNAVATIETSNAPDRLVVDPENNIWVICNSGNIQKIDTKTNEVVKTISDLNVSGFNEKMVINSTGDKLYYLASGDYPNTFVYELATTATSKPLDTLLIGVNYYGIGVSSDDMLYVGDNNGFQGIGSVLLYDIEGNAAGDFTAGRGPNGFIFY